MQPDAAGVAQLLQPCGGEHPVFAQQRDDVRHRANCRQIGEIAEQLLRQLVADVFERGNQLEYDARAAPVAERQVHVRPVRIDDGDGGGQRFGHFVMIGHNGIDAERRGVGNFFGGGNAVVHGDNQPDLLFSGTIHRRFGQAVARFAVGQRKPHVAARCIQVRHQHGRRRDAVRIVVPVHENRLECIDGLADAAHGLRHIRQIHGVAPVVVRAVSFHRFGGFKPARPQQNRQERRNSVFFRPSVSGFFVRFGKLPMFHCRKLLCTMLAHFDLSYILSFFPHKFKFKRKKDPNFRAKKRGSGL